MPRDQFLDLRPHLGIPVLRPGVSPDELPVDEYPPPRPGRLPEFACFVALPEPEGFFRIKRLVEVVVAQSTVLDPEELQLPKLGRCPELRFLS